MELSGKTIVVTGAGSGIGAALCRRFAAEKPQQLVIVDTEPVTAAAVAAKTNGVAINLDVANESAVAAMIRSVEEDSGPIDLLCMNAGIATIGALDVPNALWQRTWEVNVMSHVYAVRAALPAMLERGSGYLLHTASAAGLLTSIGAAPYTVTKHAVVALAEWLAVTYGGSGIKVSCLSPQFVDTAMLETVTQVSRDYGDFVAASTISPEEVAESVVAGIRAESFHILPHPEVASFAAKKAMNPERWIAAMRDLQDSLGLAPQRSRPSSRPQ